MKVEIVAVTKNRSTLEILNLPQKIKIIAENKVQEATAKFAALDFERKFQKHLIGKLQKNKVKKAVAIFDCIQSVDSIELANKINNEALKINKTQEIFIQVNISDDIKKNGVSENELIQLINHIKNLPNLKLSGLMTILKNNLDSNDSLKYYCDMKILFNNINKTILKFDKLEYLSMGMSDDWEIALKAGSNMLRIGKALFEKNHEKEFLTYI